ncbi:MAG: WG repeat-containing protein [Planctomycetota bacterium]|jgi:hypothetical protein
MEDVPDSHVGFGEGAPPQVEWSEQSFVRPVKSHEKLNLRLYEIGFPVAMLIAAIAVGSIIIVIKFAPSFLRPPRVLFMFVPILIGLFSAIACMFQWDITRIIFVRMVKSRPGRLFEPGPNCVFVGIEPPATFKRLKVYPDDYALLNFSGGYWEIEMTGHRARLPAEDVTISVERGWLGSNLGLKLSCNLTPSPWSVVLEYLPQHWNIARCVSPRRQCRWLVHQIRRTLGPPVDWSQVDKALSRRLTWRRVLVGVLCIVIVYVGSYCILSALGRYIFTQSGNYRYSFGLSVTDIVQWQPKYAFGQRFLNIAGKDTFRAGPLGLFYLPLILFDQKYVHKTFGIFPSVEYDYGFIDKTGRYVIKPQFKWPLSFSEGLAQVQVGAKIGFVDIGGEMVIEPKFDHAQQFSEGLAAVRIGNWLKGRCGYIDPAGNMVIEPQFQEASSFGEQRAAVKIERRWGYIDQAGQVVIRPQFDNASIFSEALAAVDVNGKWGYIDKTGQIAISPRFDAAYRFAEERALVRVGEKEGYIDNTGQMVVEPIFERASHFWEGMADVKLNQKWGYIDRTGQIVIQPQFEEVCAFSEGMAAVKIEGKWGYINKTGQAIIPAQYDDVRDFSGGLAAVKVGDKWGFIDESGRLVLEPRFDTAGSFCEGLARVGVKVPGTGEELRDADAFRRAKILKPCLLIVGSLSVLAAGLLPATLRRRAASKRTLSTTAETPSEN